MQYLLGPGIRSQTLSPPLYSVSFRSAWYSEGGDYTKAWITQDKDLGAFLEAGYYAFPYPPTFLWQQNRSLVCRSDKQNSFNRVELARNLIWRWFFVKYEGYRVCIILSVVWEIQKCCSVTCSGFFSKGRACIIKIITQSRCVCFDVWR